MHRLLTATSSLRGKMGVEVLHTIANITFLPFKMFSQPKLEMESGFRLLDYQHIRNSLIESTSLYKLYNNIYMYDFGVE